MLQSCGVSINTSLVQAEGRVLPAPRVSSEAISLQSRVSISFILDLFLNLQLKMGNGEHIIPRNGWWNNKDKVIDINL